MITAFIVVCIALGFCLTIAVGVSLVMNGNTQDAATRARLAREQEEWTSRPEFWTE